MEKEDKINTLDSPVVILNYDDIVEISNDINNEMIKANQIAPSQGYMEFLLCKIIRERFKINFFK